VRTIGLDPSLSSTGLALSSGSVARIQTTTALELLDRIDKIDRLLRGYLIDDSPELLVIEGLGGSGPGRESALKTIGLGTVLRLTIWRLRIPTLEIAPSTLKAYATGVGKGSGKAGKDAMRAAFLDRLLEHGRPGLDVNADEVDALWLRDVGRWLSGASDVAGPHPEITPKIVDGIRARALELDGLARVAGPDARGSEASCSRP